MNQHLTSFLLALAVTTFSLAAAETAANNSLTAAEKTAGWQLLFNGADLSGWHNFKKEGVRPGWQVQDGALVCVDPHNAGDIVTTNQFEWPSHYFISGSKTIGRKMYSMFFKNLSNG